MAPHPPNVRHARHSRAAPPITRQSLFRAPVVVLLFAGIAKPSGVSGLRRLLTAYLVRRRGRRWSSAARACRYRRKHPLRVWPRLRRSRHLLHPDDGSASFPPVSGGSCPPATDVYRVVDARWHPTPLPPTSRSRAGGIVIFSGSSVPDEGRPVQILDTRRTPRWRRRSCVDRARLRAVVRRPAVSLLPGRPPSDRRSSCSSRLGGARATLRLMSLRDRDAHAHRPRVEEGTSRTLGVGRVTCGWDFSAETRAHLRRHGIWRRRDRPRRPSSLRPIRLRSCHVARGAGVRLGLRILHRPRLRHDSGAMAFVHRLGGVSACAV